MFIFAALYFSFMPCLLFHAMRLRFLLLRHASALDAYDADAACASFMIIC